MYSKRIKITFKALVKGLRQTESASPIVPYNRFPIVYIRWINTQLSSKCAILWRALSIWRLSWNDWFE